MLFARRWFFCAALFSIAACTQEPAPVAFRGVEHFDRERTGYPLKAAASRSQSRPAPVGGFHPNRGEDAPQAATPAQIGTVEVAPLAPIQVENPKPIRTNSLVPSAAKTRAVSTALAPLSPQPLTSESKPVSSYDKRVRNDAAITARPSLIATREAAQSGTPLPAALPELAHVDVTPANSAAYRADAEDPSTSAAPHFTWPAEGKIVSAFGPKPRGTFNDGINIAASEGEPIWAAANGQVIYVGNQVRGYGNMALIRHDGGYVTTYAHAERLIVKKDERVLQGQVIGYVGASGTVDTAQLHFGIRQGKEPVDPENFLSRRVASR